MNSRQLLADQIEKYSLLQTALSDMPLDHPNRAETELYMLIAENHIEAIQRYLDLPENAGLK